MPRRLRTKIGLLLMIWMASQMRSGAHPSDELFGLDKVWHIHLELTGSEWARLQPPEGLAPGPFAVLQAFAGLMGDAAEGGNLHSEKSSRPGLAGYVGVDHQYGRGTVTIADQVLENVGIRFKGNGSFLVGRMVDKFSFKIDFNEYDDDLEYLGLTKINLNSNVTDDSMLREALSYELFRDAGLVASRVAWARVSLTVPGQIDNKDLGIYSIVEQVDKRFLRHRYGTGAGMLLKPSTFGTFRYFQDDWPEYEKAYFPKTKVTPEQKQRLMEFARLVWIADDAEFSQAVEAYLDMDQFLRFLAVNVLLSNLDSFLMGSQNHYVYLDPQSNRFQILPWDMDSSFGGLSLIGTAETRIHQSIDHPQTNNKLIERVLAIATYREQYRDYIRSYARTELAPQKILSLIDDSNASLRPIVKTFDDTAVRRFDRSLSDDASAERGEVTMIKPFVRLRHAAIQAQLAGESSGVVLNPAPPRPLMFVMIILGLMAIAVLMNLIAYVRGIVAGFRDSVKWGCLNIIYPMTLYYGFRVRTDIGYKPARMALVSMLAPFVIALLGAISMSTLS